MFFGAVKRAWKQGVLFLLWGLALLLFWLGGLIFALILFIGLVPLIAKLMLWAYRNRYRRAAERGDEDARNRLRLICAEGYVDATQVADEALEWHQKRAVEGEVISQAALGMMYAEGYESLGVAQDDAEALKWFHMAAEQGDADAQYELGRMHREGRGVEQDEAEAEKWFRKAAAQGHEDARNALASGEKEGAVF